MTPDEQRIAIAEACGWQLKWQNMGGGQLFNVKPPGHSWRFWIPPKGFYQTEKGKRILKDPDGDALPPDYLNDLNAMHEVEILLNNSEESGIYSRKLMKAAVSYTTEDEVISVNGWTLYRIQRATAAQRAECFLRVKGLWK